MVKITLGILLGSILAVSYAAEDDYNRAWCKAQNGELIKGKNYEVRIKGGRVDCLVGRYAIEMDFANKYKSCLGQGLDYAAKLNMIPGCVLIMGKGDEKYLEMLHGALHYNRVNMRVWTVRKQ